MTIDIRYRVVTRELIEENLSLQDATYLIENLTDQGKNNLIMEEYFPEANRLGRAPHLHLSK
jgi:hypothetical protein